VSRRASLIRNIVSVILKRTARIQELKFQLAEIQGVASCLGESSATDSDSPAALSAAVAAAAVPRSAADSSLLSSVPAAAAGAISLGEAAVTVVSATATAVVVDTREPVDAASPGHADDEILL
jgi:hypothetical protein